MLGTEEEAESSIVKEDAASGERPKSPTGDGLTMGSSRYSAELRYSPTSTKQSPCSFVPYAATGHSGTVYPPHSGR